MNTSVVTVNPVFIIYCCICKHYQFSEFSLGIGT